MQGSAIGVGIMGNIGKGLRAASFTSTEGVAQTGRESAGNGRKRANTGLVPYYGTTQVTRL